MGHVAERWPHVQDAFATSSISHQPGLGCRTGAQPHLLPTLLSMT